MFRTMTDQELKDGLAETTEHDGNYHDYQNEIARREFAKVRATLPNDPDAHPVSGRVRDY